MGHFNIPFSKPTISGDELENIQYEIINNKIGESIRNVNEFISNKTNSLATFFCTSCSHALEMSGLILDLKPGDEVIIPDYTFVTSASSFALRGVKLVFCDINLSDMALDFDALKNAITSKTKAVVWVDYAGNPGRAKDVKDFCKKNNLPLIQDAAQSFGSWIGHDIEQVIVGDFVVYSFHSTKNINSGGEGGALCITNPIYVSGAEVIYEKGTNRKAFVRGEVDKYSWRDLGASFAGSWCQAAFLWPQLQKLEMITLERQKIWQLYHKAIRENSRLASEGWVFPLLENCYNGHIFWLLSPNECINTKLRNYLKENLIEVTSHYQSLSQSPAGLRYGRISENVKNSISASENLLRLPLWYGMTTYEINSILKLLNDY